MASSSSIAVRDVALDIGSSCTEKGHDTSIMQSSDGASSADRNLVGSVGSLGTPCWFDIYDSEDDDDDLALAITKGHIDMIGFDKSRSVADSGNPIAASGGLPIHDLTGLDFFDDQSEVDKDDLDVWFDCCEGEVNAGAGIRNLDSCPDVSHASYTFGSISSHCEVSADGSALDSSGNQVSTNDLVAQSFYYVPDLLSPPTHAVYFLPEQPIRYGIHRTGSHVLSRQLLDSIYLQTLGENDSMSGDESVHTMRDGDVSSDVSGGFHQDEPTLVTRSQFKQQMEALSSSMRCQLGEVRQGAEREIAIISDRLATSLSKIVELNKELAVHKRTNQLLASALGVEVSSLHEVAVQMARRSAFTAAQADLSDHVFDCPGTEEVQIDTCTYDSADRSLLLSADAAAEAGADVADGSGLLCHRATLPSSGQGHIVSAIGESKSDSPPAVASSKPATRRGGRNHNKNSRLQQQQQQLTKQKQQPALNRNILAPDLSAECKTPDFSVNLDTKSSRLPAPYLSAERNDLDSFACSSQRESSCVADGSLPAVAASACKAGQIMVAASRSCRSSWSVGHRKRSISLCCDFTKTNLSAELAFSCHAPVLSAGSTSLHAPALSAEFTFDASHASSLTDVNLASGCQLGSSCTGNQLQHCLAPSSH